MFSWHISDCFLCPNYSYLHSRLERHNCNSSNRTIITYRTVHKQWCHCSVARSCSLYDIHMGVRYKICLGWKQGKFIQHTQKISFVTWKTFTYNPKWWVHFFITPCFIQMAKNSVPSINNYSNHRTNKHRHVFLSIMSCRPMLHTYSVPDLDP